MRNLTQAAEAAKNAPCARPIPILKIEFGGSVGTKYYSDRALSTPVAAEGRVVDWGGVYSSTALRPRPIVSDVRLRIADHDGTLSGYRSEVVIAGSPATLYQFFSGLESGDMVPIARGRLESPLEWDESTREVSLDITDISTAFDCAVGHAADRDVFPEVSEADEGRMLPLVYGCVRRAPAVHVRAGGRARLAAAIPDAEASSFIVDDSSAFPQSAEITVSIGAEHIEGSFSGNTFTVTERGASVAAGATGGYTGNPYVINDPDLDCADGQYVGCFLRMWVPYGGSTRSQLGRHGGGDWQYRRIVRCESPGVLEFYPALSPVADAKPCAVDIYLHSGAVWKPPAGSPFSIVTFASAHEAGEDVRRVLDGYTYIVNDMPSVAVRRVECHGVRKRRLARFRTERGLFAGFSGGLFVDDPRVLQDLFGPTDEEADVEDTRVGWIPLDASLYDVDTNDTTTFPGLGRAVTTVTLWRNPTELPGYSFTTDEIRVDIEGADADGDGTGDLVENPADVIRDVLVRFGDLTGSDYDGDTFDDCAARMGGLRFGFSLTRPRGLADLVQDLSFQCRTTLLWEAGVAKLRWLTAGVGAEPAATIDDDARAIDSVRVEKADVSRVTTEVRAHWLECAEERTLAVSDSEAEAAHGRRSAELDLWALPDRDCAKAVAGFWLQRLKDVWEVTHLATFLNTLELEREDAVALDLPDYYPSGMLAVVEGVEHRPGSGALGEIDRIGYRLRVPFFAGCETICEAYCETAGCESAMELTSCTSACETSCQWACQLQCQNAFQAGCAQNCQAQCQAGCQVSCTGMNMAGCSGVETGDPPEGACESACQAYCQYQATAGCAMDTCMVTCVIACEGGSCELDCTSACEAAGCESAGCTTHCTVAGCETVCQSGKQHCIEDSCGLGSCQLVCTVSMTVSCSGDCQTVCVMSCTLACQLQCTSSCESAGCTICCEVSCTSGCEDGCQSSCQYGCEAEGCQSAGCESACESVCQTGCTSSCMSACETSCQETCEFECQAACQQEAQ